MKTKSTFKTYFMLTLCIAMMAVGIYFFKFTNNFTFGGVTGLAVLIAKTGFISAGDFTFAANILLLLIGFLFLVKGFGFKTAYCSILLSVMLSALERICPLSAPLTNEPLMELIFAIALPAFASAFIFNVGASSGGTDIIAMILSKYSSVNIGKALLLSDISITVASFFVFGIETGLYSALGLTIRSVMVDSFIESLNLSKYFNIVCNYPDPICAFINHTLHKSATICKAKGAFSGQDKYIIFTAMTRYQAIKLRNFIKEKEPEAFILISNTSEIIGKGFHSI